ncbi:UNVERIFIED_CONTAM: hypothetical protein K2H54_043786 [Gekko kuhli]
MKYSFALMLIFISPSWVLSQITLVESGPGTAKPGESIRLTCTVTGYSSGYWWHWIRQPSGKGLESVAAITYYGSTYYVPSLQSRISISRDNGKRVLSQVTLVETGPGTAKPGESIRLSCKVTGYSISSGYSWHWIRQPPGKGLEWIARVLSQVTLVESGPGTAKPGESIRLTCTVTGYSISSGNAWNWIRQPPGKGLERIAAIAYSGRVVSAVTLVQWGPDKAKPGESIKLNCAVSGYTISTGYWWSWLRQPPGKALEWLAIIRYSGETYYAPTLQNRISISKDNSKNQFYLQMSSLTVADSATYYCARETQ